MKNQPNKIQFPTWALVFVFAIILLSFYFVAPKDFTSLETPVEISYSKFKQLINEGRITSVMLKGQAMEGKLHEAAKIGPKNELSQRFFTHIPDFGDRLLLPSLEAQKVEITVLSSQQSPFTTVLVSVVPWIIFIGIWIWIMQRTFRNIGGGLGGKKSDLNRFLDSTQENRISIPNVKFSDVAGQENAKREVIELVEYLKDPSEFTKMGAEVPRGVLLMGPPGTGKTLLAKALAGEAGVPFASITASEFIEVFVGVGASRVRKLFDTAKQKAPSIIFIDELDSIGRTRGTGLGGGHDEREQTLNQILAEMDGFVEHEAVIVLAATNRPDVLDPALLRPGRFDRHVTLDLPDKSDREKILKVHTRKIPIAEEVDLGIIAAGTPGFSGADIKNLVNEAAIFATREKTKNVFMRHFDEARDKLLMGTVRTLAIQPDERHRLAVHESGHTLLAYFLPHADPLYKVTIIPRGRALGGTHQLPEEERHTLPEEYLRDRLSVILGGRVAERELLDSVSSGADDDIRQATSLARAMVARWGMSKEIGPIDLRESEEHPFLGREMAQPRRFSENSAQLVDNAIHTLITEAEQKATDVIQRHRAKLEKLIIKLEENETLFRDQIDQCLGASVQEVKGL